MARSYLVGSWANADEYDYSGYSGEMLMGHRNGASRDIGHFTKSGNANVAKYGDNDLTQKKTSIPLRDRILPQGKRVSVLTDQLIELEAEYKSGKMSIQEYTQLRAVLVMKRNRATILYQKAINVKEPTEEDNDLLFNTSQDEAESLPQNDDQGSNRTPTPPSNWLDDFIAELPVTNSFRNPLKTALQMTRKAVKFSQATKRYIKILSEV